MRRALALLMACALAGAAQAQPVAGPETLELPVTLVQRVITILTTEGGATATGAAQAIIECARGQEMPAMSRPTDGCAAVTTARMARAAEQRKAIEGATRPTPAPDAPK